MTCTLEQLRQKDVINLVDGENLGRVDDLELDEGTAAIVALILYEKPGIFGFLGKRKDFIIHFHQIRLIGKDAILVELPESGNCANSTKNCFCVRKKFT